MQNGICIEPIYDQEKPNEAIDFGQVKIAWSHKAEVRQGLAAVKLSFTPSDRLSFSVPLEGEHPFFGFELMDDKTWDGKLHLTDRGCSIDVFITEVGGCVEFTPKTSGITATAPAKEISSAVFHVFNFPDFWVIYEETVTRGESAQRIQRVRSHLVLSVAGWQITISALPDTKGRCEALRREGGYHLTHMGRIEREDHAVFTSDELEDVLQFLRYLLSFALGRWAGVALPVGFDGPGNRVFEQWGLPSVAPGAWEGSCSWFDSHHGDVLQQVAAGFHALWRSELWNQTLRHTLYWYVQASDRGIGIGVDSALILAQTALERLGWTYCVQHRRMISEAAFEPRRGLSAADKLRLLVSSLDIPTALPACLPSLNAKRGQKWEDGLDAITSVRNAIVHPRPKKKLPKGGYYEAWKLSLWYLDLALLRLCGYNGQYANRLILGKCAGQVEQVPWAITTSRSE